ncbi:MAG: N-acyl homoserine lactonase family protein [Planctomycetaceae bacterium]|nr:N-acyl homoserine lactonase family protein [Planctomycetaceae bacterium]
MKITPLLMGSLAARLPPRVRRSFDSSRPPEILEPEPWSEALPIYAFLVEHPEGLIVVDTGQSPDVNQPDYFRGDSVSEQFLRQNFRFDIAPEQEIGAQLEALGVRPRDVRWVVLTHLHTDHADGIGAFPHAEILVSRREFEAQVRRPRGANVRRWPSWFSPRLVEYYPPGVGPFSESYPLTKHEDVQMVPLEGHSTGHAGLIVWDGPQAILFAGDATENQADLLAGRIPGIARSATEARASLERIREFARGTPTIYLPTHDPAGPARLAAREII